MRQSPVREKTRVDKRDRRKKYKGLQKGVANSLVASWQEQKSARGSIVARQYREDGEGLREEKKRNGRLVGASETSKSL